MTAENAEIVGRVVAVSVGLPRQAVTSEGRTWRSGIFKNPVAGPVALSRENLAGDRQSDRYHHGGSEKAVCCYSSEIYTRWESMFSLTIPWGGLGENFTTEGLTDDSACIGDVYEVGSAVVQISQPRIPCQNIARRWERQGLPGEMTAARLTGFYLRVGKEGEVAAGDSLRLLWRPHPGWTVLRANNVLFDDEPALREIEELRSLGSLSPELYGILDKIAKRASATRDL